MKLKLDFVGDWLDTLKDILENHWGYDTSGVTRQELPILYFNAEQRRPDSRSRTVKLADTFCCPTDLQTGWTRLQDLVESGADITVNLSDRVNEFRSKDFMLSDWGVHHFHLGKRMKGDLVERTGPLLFALLTNEHFYAIGVYHHGDWFDSEIVEVIHRNWPEAVSQYKIHGVTPDKAITEKERKVLRAKNANSFVSVSDGTVYSPVGGGVLCAGYNIRAVIRFDQQRSYLRSLENILELHLGNLKEELINHGYSGEQEIEAKLEITESGYIAIFPKFQFAVALDQKH